MKLIIHDLTREQAEKLIPRDSETHVIGDSGTIHPCIGCFGCWVKTPGQCVIRDQYGDMGAFISKCSDVIVISKCCYGGFSPFVKNVFDRSISYIHPYFVIRNKEMHHRPRYKTQFALHVYFYGDEITAEEKETAKSLVHANSINLNCHVKDVLFQANPEAFGGQIK